MRRTVVLGAAGFIGRHVTAALAEGGEPAAVLCLGRSGPRQPARESPPWLRFDLVGSSAEELADVLERFQPDAVVNCAGAMEGTARALFEANTVLVDTLLRAVELGAPSARVVQLGSAAEYGAVSPGQAIREEQCPRPLSPYGVSKLAATHLVSTAHVSGRVDAVVLRVFNPIGPGLTASSVLGRAAAQIRRAVAGEVDGITMGSLEAFRDFVDVRDVARAVTCAVRMARSERSLFNVARGEAMQVRGLVRRLAASAGFAGAIHERAAASPRSGAVPWQQADIEQAAVGLGWTPRVSLDSSVREVWETYAPS